MLSFFLPSTKKNDSQSAPPLTSETAETVVLEIESGNKDIMEPVEIYLSRFHFNHAQLSRLFFYAAQQGKVSMIKWLLENKADPYNRNEVGLTPLLIATKAGHDEVVQVLLENKVAIAKNLDINGNMATHYAARYGHLSICELLRKHAHFCFLWINEAGSNAFFTAIKFNQPEIVIYIDKQNYPYLYRPNKKGVKPLLQAIRSQSFDVVKWMVDVKNLSLKVDKKNVHRLLKDISETMFVYLIPHLAGENTRIIKFIRQHIHKVKDPKLRLMLNDYYEKQIEYLFTHQRENEALALLAQYECFCPIARLDLHLSILQRQRRSIDAINLCLNTLHATTNNDLQDWANYNLANALFRGDVLEEKGSPLNEKDPFLLNYDGLYQRAIQAYFYLKKCHHPEAARLRSHIDRILAGASDFEPTSKVLTMEDWQPQALYYYQAYLNWKTHTPDNANYIIQKSLAKIKKLPPTWTQEIQTRDIDGMTYMLAPSVQTTFSRGSTTPLTFPMSVKSFLEPYSFAFQCSSNVITIELLSPNNLEEDRKGCIYGELAAYIRKTFAANNLSVKTVLNDESIKIKMPSKWDTEMLRALLEEYDFQELGIKRSAGLLNV